MLANMPWAVNPDSVEDRLHRLEAVTDPTLAHLSVEQLLQELLARVRDILEADTATVLLVAGGGRYLVATASSGIEEEVRQAVHVPVGQGFAGWVAAERKPLVLDRIDATTVVNPLLWEKGLRSLAGVPLMAEGDMLGVLHIGTFSQKEFTEQDVQFLQSAADRIAASIRARSSAEEHTAASILQRNVLPARLPEVSGMEFAARYVSGDASGASGDWYDVFTLPSGWLCMAVGDVVGRGLAAASVMSRVRSAMRAYALDTSDPSEVLRKLDRNMRHFEPGAMATVAFGMVDPSLTSMRLSLAGHPAPVIADRDDNVRLADAPVDAPIGAGFSARKRRTTTLDIPYGATALFYTDGLVDRRDRTLDEGLRMLCESMRSGPPEAVCAGVMARLVGYSPTYDDIAILAVRRQDLQELRTMDVELEAVPESLGEMRAALRRWLPGVGASEDEIADLLVATGEAAANVVEHAYGPRGGKLSVRLEARPGDPGEVWVTVSDNGTWRAPRGQHRGRGMHLMRELCDDVRVEHTATGTDVHLMKRLSGDAE